MQFLNIDLEVRAARRPATLIAELGEKAVILYDGEARGAHLTVVEVGNGETEKKTLARFMKLFDQLSPAARRQLEAARGKEFNFGYLCEKGEAPERAISHDLLRVVVAAGCSRAITFHRSGK